MYSRSFDNEPTQAPLARHLAKLGILPALVSEVTSCFRLREVPRLGCFLHQGETADRIGFVVSGLLSMEVLQYDGHLFIKDFLVPGDFLLGAFEPGAPSLVTFTALRKSMLLQAPYSAILALQARHPELETLARQGMASRYQNLCQRLEQQVGWEAAERYEAFCEAFTPWVEAIPLHKVAAYLGITPTQLSRIRARKKGCGLNPG